MSGLIAKEGFLLATNATLFGNYHIGKCVNIWYGAVIRADLARITIGDYTNIQDNCVLHTDPDQPLAIGCYVTVGHNAILHCSAIGDYTLIGMGSTLLAGAKIGQGCIIGAGSLVTENMQVPDFSVVVGVPGRIIRQLDEKVIADHKLRAEKYYQNALTSLSK